MTFDAQESSRALGAPIGLLLFTYGDGDGDYYGYTDGEETVTFNSKLFVPIPTDQDAVVASGTLDKATIDIRLPQDTDIVKLFDIYPPSYVVLLSIYQGHVGNTDFELAWAGRVLSFKTQANETAFTCEPISTTLLRMGLSRKYQYGCPHVLYGPQCGADKAAATTAITVEAVDGPIVTLPGGWDAGQSTNYLNGLATWTTPDGRVETRTILQIIDAENVQLGGAIQGLVGGGTINMTLGCNHQMGGCIMHNNIQNFGGCPWIPFKNPIGVTNNFF
jgi:hypothetical protein